MYIATFFSVHIILSHIHNFYVIDGGENKRVHEDIELLERNDIEVKIRNFPAFGNELINLSKTNSLSVLLRFNSEPFLINGFILLKNFFYLMK